MNNPILMRASTSQSAAYTRREFTKVLALAVPGLVLGSQAAPLASKPNSKVNGVQIGLNVPYSFGSAKMSADEILQNCVQLGLSGVELRLQPIEVFLGAPAELVHAPKETANTREQLADWRKSMAVNKAKPFRSKCKAAGVRVEILKVDGIFQMTDAELNYVFGLARTLGVQGISTEISRKTEELQRVGSFADKHKVMVGYHGHASTTPEHWEEAFALAKYNGANVDLGHFVAGNNVSPADFIRKHHKRITHVHVKDRKRNNGPNTPFGEGDTPITEILQLIRDNRWKIQATIEFEYKVPAGSDRMTEIARTIQFCRQALA